MKKTILASLLILFGFTFMCAQKGDTHTKVADQFPMFPGCDLVDVEDHELRKCADQELFKYIGTNLKYPAEARKNNVEGTVFVKFIVDENGYIKSPEVTEDIGAGCGEAALSVISKMMDDQIKWVPAKAEGKNVSMEIALPFRFKL